MKNERITVKVKEARILCSRSYGYSGSGVFPRTYSYFILATDENGNVYTLSTSQKVKSGDEIKASVIGNTIYNGVNQTKLSRVTIM